MPCCAAGTARSTAEAIYEKALFKALQQEYKSIFFATAIICLVGAVIALALDGRRAQQATDDAREAKLATE